MEQRLSGFLLSQVDLFDREGVKKPSAQESEARFLLQRIVEEILTAREAFTGDQFAVLEKAIQNEPEIIEAEVDRVLSCQLLENVPTMVSRWIRLSKLSGTSIPSDQTAAYVREAVRTYAGGFIQASVAMSRAALEQALKEVLNVQASGKYTTLTALTEEARKLGIIDASTAEMAKNTVKKANEVLHECPTDHEGAFNVLISVRGLLAQIYSTLA